MADKLTYKRGHNPNSLANLEKGRAYTDKEFAKKCSEKGNEIQRTKRTMQEITETMLQEEQAFLMKDGSTVTFTKLEIIIQNFIKECASNPTHKNVLALRSLMGEDVQHIETKVNVQGKYNEITITKEMIAKAEAIFDAQAESNAIL